MDPSFDPVALLLMVVTAISGGVRDLASLVSTDAYWKAKGVVVSYEQLTHDLEPARAADISKLIDALNADDARERDAAAEKIALVGPAALPALQEASGNAAPEVAARAKSLITRITVVSKSIAVRRLMAIRTLGQRHDPQARQVLTPLLQSREMFEADYARIALARLAGRREEFPAATDADKAADVTLLPARLDSILQVAPALGGELSIDSMVAALGGTAEQRTQLAGQNSAQLIGALDMIGNVRLDVMTWGFYAAPPGVPGNSILILRGEFDAAAVNRALARLSRRAERVDAADVFRLNDDAAVVVSGKRVIFLAREAQGDLALEPLTAALKAGQGDLATNLELSKLVNSVNTKAPLWGAARLSPGLAEIVGPLGQFDSATLVGAQTRNDQGELMTQVTLTATTTDAAKARQAANAARDQIKNDTDVSRRLQDQRPGYRAIADLEQSFQFNVVGGEATVTATMKDLPLIPASRLLGPIEPGNGS